MRNYQENYFVGVAVILKRGNKILLGKRKNVYGAGDYGLPGGHLNYGEKLYECGLRELKEETGVEAPAENFRLVAVVDDPRSDQHYIHTAFLLEDFQHEPQCLEPEKCEGWEWFDLDALPNIFVGHAGIIETFKSGKLYLT